jgi:ubiquinone/menaquinone biosynthesis C-methylase UbiE
MLEKRSTEAEFTDQPNCDTKVADQAYSGMAVFNKISGATTAVRKFVMAEAMAAPANRPFRVLDIGAGSCDIPLAISEWARKHGVDVQITCLDYSPRACELAREKIARAGDSNVRVVQADIFTYEPDEPFDCAVGSFFFHHFTEDEILKIARRLKTFVRRSLLINDLLRYCTTYVGGWILTLLFPAELRHDVLVSIERGFKVTELRHLFRKIPGATVTSKRHRFFRVLATVRFEETSV